MRIAKCIAPLQLHVMGNAAPSVMIGEGWQGDVDAVIGKTGDGRPVTIADSLGDHLVDATKFQMVDSEPKERSAAKKSTAAAPHSSQE